MDARSALETGTFYKEILPVQPKLPDMREEVESVKRHCVVWPSHFQKNFCEYIISLYDRQDRLQPATVGSVNGIVDAGARNCLRADVEINEHKDFVDYLYDSVMTVNDKYFGFKISRIGQIDFLKYQGDPVRGQSSYYKPHSDVLWSRNYDRKISCIIQLSENDDYEGGDFKIVGDNECLMPVEHKQQGSLIMFNSMVQHGIAPVTIGTRYSLAVWMHGPNWR